MPISHRPRQGPRILAVILLSLCTLTFPASSQSTDVSDSSCFQNGFYDCSTCSCQVNEPIHHTFIFIIHLISLIISLLFIIIFFYVQGLRRHPGSIVVALTFANFIYALEGAITSMKNITTDQVNDNSLCIAFGYINFVSLTLTYLYQMGFFAFYTYIKHQQRSSRTLNYEYHIVPIALTVFATIYLYSQDAFGMTIGGGCSIKSSANVAAPTITFGVLIAISFCLIYLMRRIFTRESPVGRAIIVATSRYSRYLLITCFVYVGICILRAAMAIYVGEYSPSTQNSVSGAIDTIEVFMAILQVINPLLVMMAWLRDPKSHEPLQRSLGEYRWLNWLWTTKTSYTMEDLMDDDEHARLDRALLTDGSSEAEAIHIAENHALHGSHVQGTVNRNIHSKEYKLNVIFTILVSIRYYWHMQKHRKLDNANGDRDRDPLTQYKRDARSKASFHINTAHMQREIPRVLEEIVPQSQDIHQNILQGVLTVYAMNLFAEVINLDEMGKYIQLSLDVGKNFNKVIKTGFNPKGTNTAFDFMSEDNKLIFRSITENELNALLKLLPYFIMHLKSNQNSLIAKIYGAFTYEVMTPHQKWHFIAIRNMNRHLPHRVERTYELKGTARFRRTVMEDNVSKMELRHSGVLKDYDFNNFEKSIKIDPEMQTKLLNTLRRDVHFLASHDLIDYSLNLFVVSREKLPSVLSDVLETAEQFEESFPEGEKGRGESVITGDSQNLDSSGGARKHNPLSQIESSDEELDYVIDITDYLKEYNTRKRINILLRNWGLNHSHHDLTSEEPNLYGGRFMNYLERIIES